MGGVGVSIDKCIRWANLDGLYQLFNIKTVEPTFQEMKRIMPLKVVNTYYSQSVFFFPFRSMAKVLKDKRNMSC